MSTHKEVAHTVTLSATVHPPVTCHTEKVVSGILTHRIILTDGRGGQEQATDNFKIANKRSGIDLQ